jgi:hypothetical protein
VARTDAIQGLLILSWRSWSQPGPTCRPRSATVSSASCGPLASNQLRLDSGNCLGGELDYGQTTMDAAMRLALLIALACALPAKGAVVLDFEQFAQADANLYFLPGQLDIQGFRLLSVPPPR